MSDKQLLDLNDIRFARFRLPHQDLSSSGSGCVVTHVPTDNSALSEVSQPYALNKKAALTALAVKLGISEGSTEETLFNCPACMQEISPTFIGWEQRFEYRSTVNKDYPLIVFYTAGADDGEAGWTWDVLTDEDLDEGVAAVFETPEGAVRAAEEWFAKRIGAELQKKDVDDV